MTTLQIHEYSLDRIQKNAWNVNKMEADKFDLLLEDMRENGRSTIDPILVRRIDVRGKPTFYEIVDGEHRYKAAKLLKWTAIPAIMEEMTEVEARVLNYRKNSERGTIDPVAEGERFRDEIANIKEKGPMIILSKRYGLRKDYISRRIALVQVEKPVREKLSKGVLNVSQVEAIIPLRNQEDRKEILEAIEEGDTTSVRDIEHEVKSLQVQRKKTEELKKAVDESKFKTCPQCKKPAQQADAQGLPWVRDEHWHEWNLKTGKRRPYDTDIPVSQGGTRKKKPEIPGTIRSKTSVEEYGRLMEVWAREKLANLKDVDEITFRGKNWASDTTFRRNGTVYFSYYEGGRGKGGVTVTMKPHKYKDGEVTQIELNGFNTTKAEFKRVEDFLEELSKLKTKIRQRGN